MISRPSVEDLYLQFHRHPELSFHENETAATVETELKFAGFEVYTGLGRTGVVGIIRNGPGEVVLLRADMDALPVREDTGLDYASTETTLDENRKQVPVMHACGHDVHVACLIGAARHLSRERKTWSGTLIALFQPAEEMGAGAQAMVDDGLFELIPKPNAVFGQHVSPLPAGFVALQPGPAFAAADSLKITLFGEGGHGSRPESTIDPVVMAAATILRLQTIMSREVSSSDMAVLTIGYVHAGSKDNVIPSSAEVGVNIRTYTKSVRQAVLQSVERIVAAEAAASGATRPPEIEFIGGSPSLYNSLGATSLIQTAFESHFGDKKVLNPGPVTGSEDMGILATTANSDCVYWLLGGADPTLFENALGKDGMMAVSENLPSNHSPRFAPVPQPTLATGVEALVCAAKSRLALS